VDQDGEVVDVYLQAKRDGAAAKRLFKRLLQSHGGEPIKIVTDKLRSYGVAHREWMPSAVHDTSQYANNRAEQSHAPRPRSLGHHFPITCWALMGHAFAYHYFSLTQRPSTSIILQLRRSAAALHHKKMVRKMFVV
jgi:hypothetical protein